MTTTHKNAPIEPGLLHNPEKKIAADVCFQCTHFPENLRHEVWVLSGSFRVLSGSFQVKPRMRYDCRNLLNAQVDNVVRFQNASKISHLAGRIRLCLVKICLREDFYHIHPL